jgi:signal transduction histidine kinase
LYVLAQVDDYLVVRPMRLDVINLLGMLSLVITIGAAALGAWLAYRYTLPLRRLTELVGEADPAGLPAQFAQQFDDLETRQLATRLEQNYGRIAALVERERHFTREASHELRTPLAVINNALELLRAQPMTAQQTLWLERIGLAAGVMQQSVEALLMLAREELGAARRKPVSVLPLVERAVVDQATQLGQRPVSVHVDLPADWSVVAHEGALQVIVSNLVGNAFQHCREGEISVCKSGAALSITNPAAALTAEVAQRATEPEVRGADSEGLGLGLAIVDRLCNRLGWTFTFRRLGDGAVEAAVDFGAGA